MGKKNEIHRRAAKPGLKMKELMEATGLPKSTLLYYVSMGLIPEPKKTSPNMAYYDPICIEQVKFIQNMKHRHRLSLSEIRSQMVEWGDDAPISRHVELTDLVFGPLDQENLMDRKAFLAATGLTNNQTEALLKAMLLMPLNKEQFGREDVVMGKTLAQGLAWGLKIEDLAFYVATGKQMVDHEMKIRQKMTRTLPVKSDAVITQQMLKSARITRAYIMERLFQHRVAGMSGLKDERSEP
jgi:DNA-binding transcriptional MerR regulator